MGNHVLAIHSFSLLDGSGARKVTLGITESSGPRAHIEDPVCFLDVVCSYPGLAAEAKGGAVRTLKRNLRWV